MGSEIYDNENFKTINLLDYGTSARLRMIEENYGVFHYSASSLVADILTHKINL